jgi:hypothetical protein
MEHLGSQVLRFGAVSYSPNHVGIHTLEVVFVKLGKARGILLRCFD